jgi:hypothetical protein
MHFKRLTVLLEKKYGSYSAFVVQEGVPGDDLLIGNHPVDRRTAEANVHLLLGDYVDEIVFEESTT